MILHCWSGSSLFAKPSPYSPAILSCTLAERPMSALPLPSLDQIGSSAISGSSNLIALRGRCLHLAGAYELDGLWVGAYVDDDDLRRMRSKPVAVSRVG